MAIQVNETDAGRTIEVRVSGKLVHEDYRHFVPEFERLAKQHGKLRVLFEMADFHGWDTAALWDDVKFDVGHFSDIERLAMVGDKRGEKGKAGFCQPFTTPQVRYFRRTALHSAHTWQSESDRLGASN